jgi:hypothetical protein
MHIYAFTIIPVFQLLLLYKSRNRWVFEAKNLLFMKFPKTKMLADLDLT